MVIFPSGDETTKMNTHKFPTILLASIMLFAVGCGSGEVVPDKYKVSGTASLDGAPLAEGTITLDPIKGAAGVPAMGAVTDGKFEFEAVAGEYTARFDAMNKTGEKDQYGEEIVESLIPDKYNATSELTASVKEEDNTLSFEMTTK